MTDDREEQLDQIIADYLQRQESGDAVAAEDLIAAHPEFAAELREFLDDLGQLDRLPGQPAVPTLSRPPAPNTLRYFGDYELLEEIARGGMGVVYRARQTSLNRIVAVKLILSGNLASEMDVKRFRTEAEAAANLKHPNIVAVHEVGDHEGQNYFSMDYVDGQNLSQIVRERPLAVKTAAEYVRQIAVAIDYAHRQSTLHRDLKPSNVLIDSEGDVQITDFGLATRVDGDSELTRTGQILGTPSYMPPEQAQHQREFIGPGSDVYSIGAILYELLTSRPPFRAESAVETLRQVIEVDPPALQLLNPQVPRDLATICLKCLQKEPRKRYLTSGELAEDLTRFLNGEPIQARPVGRLERSWRWCRRNPSAAGLLGAVSVLLLGMFSGAVWFVHDRGERRVEQVRLEGERNQKVIRLEQGIEDALETARTRREQAWTLTQRLQEWGAMLQSARSALQQAASLLEQEPERIDPELWRRLEELGKELDLDERDQLFAARCDEIRMEMAEVDARANVFRGRIGAFARLREALTILDVHVGQTPVETVVDRFRSRPHQVQQNWVFNIYLCARNVPRNDSGVVPHTDWFRAIFIKIDPDPWITEVRVALGEPNSDELVQLAREADPSPEQLVPVLMLANKLIALDLENEGLALLNRLHSTQPGDFWLNYTIAFVHFHADRFELAARYFHGALAVRPGNAGAWVNLALALEEGGDAAAAESALQRAVELSPDYTVAWDNLGNLLRDRGRFADAEKRYLQAVELAPDDPIPCSNMGYLMAVRKNPAEAEKWYRRALEIDPKRATTWVSLGIMLKNCGSFEEAERCLRTALELDSEATEADHHLGQLLERLGRWDEAEKWHRHAIERRPAQAEYHFDLGNVLRVQRRWAAAESEYRTAIDLDATYWRPVDNLGLVLAIQGEFDESEQWLQRAIELQPDKVGPHINLGITLENLERPDEAEASYRRGISTPAEDSQDLQHLKNGRLVLGNLLLRRGDFAEYFRVVLPAIELDPNDASLHNNLAWWLATCPDVSLRDADRAIQLVTRALQLDPNGQGFQNTLGVARYRAGQWREAIEDLSRSVEIVGDNATDFFFLAMAHWQIDEQNKAREWFDRAVDWTAEHDPANEAVERFHAEAAGVLGVSVSEPFDRCSAGTLAQ